MDELVSESLAQRRFTTLLMSSFAGLAAVLAAIGLFGVISYVVSERRRELAVGIALAANRRTICWMILLQGSEIALAGCALGLLGFAVGSRLIRANLYQVSAFDPLALLASPLVLVGVALLACYWPARRAMRSDPIGGITV